MELPGRVVQGLLPRPVDPHVRRGRLAGPRGPGRARPHHPPRVEQQYAGLHNVIVRDGETYGYQRIDGEIADITVAKLGAEGAGFDVGFTYFCDIDDAGHVHGLGGEHYRAAIRRVDGHISRIIEAVEKRFNEQGEDWLVVVTTDHGHRDEGGHGGASDRERESWVLAWAPNGVTPAWPDTILPHELCEMMLDARELG